MYNIYSDEEKFTEAVKNTPQVNTLHCKKRFSFFPSPAGMSLTKLSLAGNNLIIPGLGEFGQ
jgi:hypothetical protein